MSEAVEDRPVKRRSGARIVVLAGDEVLLQSDTDPGVPGSRWWVTPGGGIDGDEDPRVAAARELREETGLEVAPAQLRGPVATRVATHGYSDRILVQEETFYQVRVARFEPHPAALTDGELLRLTAQRWFRVDSLPWPLWPERLRELVDWEGGEPLDLGHVEESTVPLRS